MKVRFDILNAHVQWFQNIFSRESENPRSALDLILIYKIYNCKPLNIYHSNMYR